MNDPETPFSDPIASTSRAVFTLPYKPPPGQEHDENQPGLDSTRLRQYEEAWSICAARIQETLASLHDASLDRIVTFVRSRPSDTDPLALYAALSGGRVPLKTGLILGASPGSSSLIYNSLIRQLVHPSRSRDTAEQFKSVIVSRLTSRECSNIKNALRSLIAGFVGSDADLEADDDDDEDAVFAQQRSAALLKSTLMVPEDLQNLVAWYSHRFGKKSKEQAPTLVLLIEDLEAVDGKVLTQLIAALSHLTTTLPLVLLIGVATTANAVHNLLSRDTTNRLDMSHFFVDPGVGAFNALIRGVFVDFQPPLALGPKAYNDLYRSFEDVHHSIDSTITWIQCLYLNHFLTSPFASLALVQSDPRPPSTPLSVAVPSLGAEPLTVGAVAKARNVLEEATAVRSEAFEGLLAMLEFWDKKRTVEHCLNLLLGASRTLDETGKRGTNDGMKKTIDDLCGLVLQASSTKLPSFLRAVTDRLVQCAPAARDPSPLLRFLQFQARELEQILSKPRPAGRANLINTHLAGGGGGANHLPGFGELTAGKNTGVSELDRAFSRIAKDVSDGLRDRFKSALRPCHEFRGFEIFYSDDTSASKRLNPATFPQVVKTLARLDPLSPLSSFADTRTNDDTETRSIPLDLAIAYRAYKDLNAQGKLINLGDWWSGFELGAGDEPPAASNATSSGGQTRSRRLGEGEEEDSDDEDEDDEDGPARRKQARFLRAVADLAHLGFVHPTTRKPEHVLKSVY